MKKKEFVKCVYFSRQEVKKETGLEFRGELEENVPKFYFCVREEDRIAAAEVLRRKRDFYIAEVSMNNEDKKLLEALLESVWECAGYTGSRLVIDPEVARDAEDILRKLGFTRIDKYWAKIPTESYIYSIC